MASAAPQIPALARDRAFESLYRRYADDVYRYALALLRNPADAEDVTQTTFLNAYRAVKRGEEIEKPQNWLITIAHNAARSRYARASRRVAEVPLEEHLEQLAVPEIERPQVQEVLDALGRLPLNQRAALVMRELEGRTYAEIADTLGVSVSAVETLIFRARRSLRVNASSIRVLGVVPAPGWLWNLLDQGGGLAGSAAVGGGAAMGGGAAAGGGTIVSSGFLLKAAVAIVAGVVASGINSDSPRKADAARTPLTSLLSTTNAGKASSTRIAGGEGRADGEAAGVAASPAVGAGEVPIGEAPGVAANERLANVPQPATGQAVVIGTGTTGGGVVGSLAASAAATLPGSSAAANAIGTPSQVVTTTVSTVANTVPLPAVPSVPVSVPAVPVSVPVSPPSVHVPSVPVQVPSVPVKPPSVPVKVPSSPIQVQPPPVQLPPPPVPLPLP
jgi:RNA polymerase sigma factor (sigma-70 family)